MSTEITSIAVVNSSIDSTRIGANVPDDGTFVAAVVQGETQTGTLDVLSGATVTGGATIDNLTVTAGPNNLAGTTTTATIVTNALTANGNVALNGTTTAVTPSVSDNSTKVATTAWNLLGFAASLGVNGYIKLPSWMGGLILQWGLTGAFDTGPIAQALSIPFPNGGFAAFATDATTNGRIYTAFISTAPGTNTVTIHNNGSSYGNFLVLGH